MNYSILKKILMVSAIFTTYESSVDAAGIMMEKIDNFGIDKNINKGQMGVEQINGQNKNKQFNGNFYNNIKFNPIKNNNWMFGNNNKNNNAKNNHYNKQIFVNNTNNIGSETKYKQKYEQLVENIQRDFFNAICNFCGGNRMNISNYMLKLGATNSAQKYGGSNAFVHMFNEAIAAEKQLININNVKSPAIDLLATFNVLKKADDLSIANNNYSVLFSTLHKAANEINNNNHNSLKNLLTSNIRAIDNDYYFFATLASIVEKSDITISHGDCNNINNELGDVIFSLSKNGKLYNKDFMFECIKELSMDNVSLINNNSGYLKSRKENLQKLIDKFTKNTVISDSEYAMLLTNEIFSEGNKDKLNNFIDHNTEQFKSAGDLALALINTLYSKDSDKEVGNKGIDKPSEELTEADKKFYEEVVGGKHKNLKSNGKIKIGSPEAKADNAKFLKIKAIIEANN